MRCVVCGKEVTIKCMDIQIDLYFNSDAPVQEIFFDHPVAEREMLISQICQKCQADIFR